MGYLERIIFPSRAGVAQAWSACDKRQRDTALARCRAALRDGLERFSQSGVAGCALPAALHTLAAQAWECGGKRQRDTALAGCRAALRDGSNEMPSI